MSQSPGILLTLLAFFLVIGPLVFLHELGHYLVGRWCGVHAEAFSIGFGREIFGWTDRRGTRWKIAMLPLGGYVKFAGDMDPSSLADRAWLELPPAERARTFQAKPVWQRALIIAAGPIANFLVAIAILGGLAAVYGEALLPPVIASVQANSPAAAAGLRAGDRVTAIDGRQVERFQDLSRYVVLRPGFTVRVDVLRDGEPAALRLRIGEVREKDRFGNVVRIGRIGAVGAPGTRTPVPLWRAPIVGVQQTGLLLGWTLDGLGQILSGARSARELGGPLQIAKISGEQLATGWINLIFLMALVSINLGFINLLPIPVLDGGHLLFCAVEAVRRRPADPAVVEWAFRGGLVAVLALMIMATVNDLDGLGLWSRLAGLIG